VEGIWGPLLVGFVLFFGADFFAAIFLVDFIFPALELRRALLEPVFFIVSASLYAGIENVKGDC
jgi:hypothetical protein